MNTLETTVSVNTTVESRLIIYASLSTPANANAALGTVTPLATFNVPTNWLNDASNGVKTLVSGLSATAAATGTARFFRLVNIAEATTPGSGQVWMQGDMGTTGAPLDLNLNSLSITSGAAVTISTFTLTAGN